MERACFLSKIVDGRKNSDIFYISLREIRNYISNIGMTKVTLPRFLRIYLFIRFHEGNSAGTLLLFQRHFHRLFSFFLSSYLSHKIVASQVFLPKKEERKEKKRFYLDGSPYSSFPKLRFFARMTSSFFPRPKDG